MQNDVYDYTSQGSVAKNTVLQKTYRLLGLSFIPA
ncbi:BAX inhibitor (BI)-1/YccA family protein, partial [Neisseria sp. P0001.S004]